MKPLMTLDPRATRTRWTNEALPFQHVEQASTVTCASARSHRGGVGMLAADPRIESPPASLDG
jgi:hypothetical protein